MGATEDHSSTGQSAPHRGDFVPMLLLLVLAAMGQPLLAVMLSEFSGAAALVAPPLLLVLTICILCPHVLSPLLSVLAIYATEAAILLSHDTYPAPSMVRILTEGRLQLLGIPVAALAVGYAAVLARRRRPLWRWPVKSELPTLNHHPWLFVRTYRWALLLLLVGASLDAATTMNLMYAHGTSGEVHPAMRMMAELLGITMGVPIGTLVRMGFVVFVAALWRGWCGWILLACGILYCLAAASNHFYWL